MEITNRIDIPLLDAAVPPTSRELETAGVPLINIANQSENALLTTALPSTSRGIYN